MRRRAILAGAVALVLGGFFLADLHRTSGAGPDSGFLLRSVSDLLSLRALLANPKAQAELSSICGPLSLCEVTTQSAPAAAGEGCLPAGGAGAPGEKTRHSFVFATNDEASSRGYTVVYTTCNTAPGEYVIALERQGYRTRTPAVSPPVLLDPDSLRILGKALDDPGVSSDLIDTLRQHRISFLRIRYVGTDLDPSILKYRLLAGGEDSNVSALFEYDAEYRRSTGEIFFSRAE